jgi:hypothetical protein
VHPVIMRQLAADQIRELITEAENAQRCRQARRIHRRGQPAPLRRSTGLYAQQRQSRLSPGPASPLAPRSPGRPSADDRPVSTVGSRRAPMRVE